MLSEINFEANRIFGNKIKIACLITILLLSVFSVYRGIEDHRDFHTGKKNFLNFEEKKVKKYVNYDQFGGYGFRVIFEPSTLNIFFNGNGVYENLYSNIDMTEIIEVNSSLKGKNLFRKRGHFKDFSDILYIFGGIFMLFMGMTAYKNENHFFKFGNTLIRLGILIIFFFILVLLLFHFPRLFNIDCIEDGGKALLGFSVFLIVFLSFFFSLGLFIRTIFKKSIISIICSSLIGFILIFVLPDIINISNEDELHLIPKNEIVNLLKLDEVMKFEADVKKAVKGIDSQKERDKIYKEMTDEFFRTGYLKNKKIEYDINSKVSTVVEKIGDTASILPTSFFRFLSGEMSSKAYNGYTKFVVYVLNLRHEFVMFILHKRYQSNDSEIETFVKNSENIFNAKSNLPKAFAKGTGFTLAYTLLFFIASFLLLKHRRNQKKETLKPTFIQDDGRMYYLLCQNEKYMNMIYHHYEKQPNTACIDKINGKDIDPGISLPKMTGYFCKLMGANNERTLEHLEKLGITNLQNEKRTPETIKKIYCAVSLAVECDTFVIKDFISRESRTFERKFLALLKYMMEQDTTIIYLGTEPLQTDSKLRNDPGKIDKYQDLKIDDPLAFILR